MLPLLRDLQIRRPGADKHRGAAEQLADGLPKIILDVGARLRIANRKSRGDPPAASATTTRTNRPKVPLIQP